MRERSLNLVNGFTSLLMSFLLHTKPSLEGDFGIFFLYFLNLLFFYTRLAANKESLAIHHLLGKSHNQTIKEVFHSTMIWQWFVWFLIELVFFFLGSYILLQRAYLMVIIVSLIWVKVSILEIHLYD